LRKKEKNPLAGDVPALFAIIVQPPSDRIGLYFLFLLFSVIERAADGGKLTKMF